MTRAVLPLLLFAVCAAAGTPNQDEIRKRQAELAAIREQVRVFEQRINEQRKNEHEALELVDTYDRKATLVRRLITRLRTDEKDLQSKITASAQEGEQLERQLEFLRRQYAQYVTTAYRHGRTRDLELLLGSASINQFLVRTSYLRRFTAQRKRDADQIGAKKKELEEIQARIQEELSQERRLIAEKGAEEDRMTTLAAERRSVVSQIQKDRKMTQRSIDRKMKAARELEDLVASLIEADRVKRERETVLGRKEHVPPPPTGDAAFDARRGRLRWPVQTGSVVAHFGNQRHPTLKTITQNTGIDIAVEAGTPVSAVADGEVARIWWLPGYGNLVILSHPNGFRTVYAHLAEITVAEGQNVKEGDPIGESGESIDGPRIHFEIWKEREKQNPEQWLSPQ
jgi:septal ring factor EnvC (AmiA/AmiB activator)